MRAINPNMRLVIVGDGPLRASMQAQYPEVIFCGMRSGEDLARHYASGDVFLFASMTETFGNVTTEAMASGLAVVAYDYAAAQALIHHGENGLIAPFDDAQKFIAAACELAHQPALAKALGHAAHQTALTIAWDHIHQRFEKVLQSIIDKEEYDGEIELAVDG
jgi:glycosyltransferase involved in cell wall biosynthesis